jgi:prepilin-type N-terminal cleavage/methylation domain-containing protein
MKRMQYNIQQLGFSLVEMAIVLVIVGFLLAAVLLPLQAQRNIAAQLATEAILEDAKKALIGFAQTHGHLPCPATNNGSASFPDDTGTAHANASGGCVAQAGFLPAKTLGLQTVDAQGYALDAWHNRIRYAITSANNGAFSKPNGMYEVGITALTPDLKVCATVSAAACTNSIHLIDNAAAVIFSLGATANQVSGGADENQNLIAPSNSTFISHPITTSASANGEFDHMVTWLSPYVLYNAMIVAGQIH